MMFLDKKKGRTYLFVSTSNSLRGFYANLIKGQSSKVVSLTKKQKIYNYHKVIGTYFGEFLFISQRHKSRNTGTIH